MLLLKQWTYLQGPLTLMKCGGSHRGDRGPGRACSHPAGLEKRSWEGGEEQGRSCHLPLPCSAGPHFFILMVSGNGAMGRDPGKGHSLSKPGASLSSFPHSYIYLFCKCLLNCVRAKTCEWAKQMCALSSGSSSVHRWGQMSGTEQDCDHCSGRNVGALRSCSCGTQPGSVSRVSVGR